jgi:hypothetical protein
MVVLDLKMHNRICEPSRRFSQGRSAHVFRPTCVYPDHGLYAAKTFQHCVARYQGNFSLKHFTCMDQFRIMAFAQLAYRESLRDIEACLRAQSNKFYHMGIRSRVSRSTLAEANEVRDWRIYADFAYHLIGIAGKLYCKEPLAVELQNTVYAPDATTIDLTKTS